MKISYSLAACAFMAAFNMGHASNGSNGSLPGNMPVNETAFLLAHNASTAGWAFYRQQNVDIKTLMSTFGVRGMKIPLHWYSKKGVIGKAAQLIGINKAPKNPPYIALCHESTKGNNCSSTLLQTGGRSPKPAVDFFKVIAEFANSNPNEVIILRLESRLHGKGKSSENGAQDMSEADVTKALDKMFEDSGLAKYAFKVNGSWPSLGQMRGGKRVIIFTNEDDFMTSSYLTSQKGNLRQAHWQDAKRKDCTMVSSAGGMFEVNINYEVSIDKNSLKGIGAKFYRWIKGEKTPVNSYDFNKVNSTEAAALRIEECKNAQNDKLAPNIIASDFVEKGSLSQLVDYINQERATSKRR